MRESKKEKIQIGKKVEITVFGDDKYPDVYKSKIDDINEEEEEVYIGLPIEKGVIVPLRIGSKIKISMLEEDAIYSFTGKLKSRARKPYPYFKMDYPQKIVRQQRRDFVRMTLNLIVSIIIKEEEELIKPKPKLKPKEQEKETKEGKEKEKEEDKELKVVTMNISGGGMYIMSGIKLKKEDKMYVTFTLPDGTACKNIKITIRREQELKEGKKIRYGYGLLFENMNRKLSDAIVSYLFGLQRDRRKKGIEI